MELTTRRPEAEEQFASLAHRLPPDQYHYQHYRTLEEKRRDAMRYREDEGIPWTLLVDDLEGTVHQVYGGLADPTYLIDRDGRVAYYNMWSYMPSLHQAIGDLLAQGERGVVRE